MGKRLLLCYSASPDVPGPDPSSSSVTMTTGMSTSPHSCCITRGNDVLRTRKKRLLANGRREYRKNIRRFLTDKNLRLVTSQKTRLETVHWPVGEEVLWGEFQRGQRKSREVRRLKTDTRACKRVAPRPDLWTMPTNDLGNCAWQIPNLFLFARFSWSPKRHSTLIKSCTPGPGFQNVRVLPNPNQLANEKNTAGHDQNPLWTNIFANQTKQKTPDSPEVSAHLQHAPHNSFVPTCIQKLKNQTKLTLIKAETVSSLHRRFSDCAVRASNRDLQCSHNRSVTLPSSKEVFVPIRKYTAMYGTLFQHTTVISGAEASPLERGTLSPTSALSSENARSCSPECVHTMCEQWVQGPCGDFNKE